MKQHIGSMALVVESYDDAIAFYTQQQLETVGTKLVTGCFCFYIPMIFGEIMKLCKKWHYL
ncbi:hypothetical protein [Pseudoalteromonas mariniglutinosa]|uniref:hypothetical protein n=1 Tax=Pseudoalteromonas mariniglutinosa TaxID=206042 RepID=UPI0038505619